MTTSIVGVIQKIDAQIRELLDRKEAIQAECSHPKEARVSEYRASTGNPYVPDEYWVAHHCELCDKRWTEPQ